MDSPLRELVNIILSENSGWSATPVFFSGKQLKPASESYFYIGSITSGNSLLATVLDTETTLNMYSGGPFTTFYSLNVVNVNEIFDFVGYRIYAPGRIVLSLEAVIILIVDNGGFGDQQTGGELWRAYTITIRGSQPESWVHRTLRLDSEEQRLAFYGQPEQALLDAGFFRYNHGRG